MTEEKNEEATKSTSGSISAGALTAEKIMSGTISASSISVAPGAMIGSMKVDPTSGVSHVWTGSTWIPITSGGYTGGTYSGTTTLPTPLTWSPTPTPAPPAPAKKAINVLDAPAKQPRKLLIAFLGENDEVEWCGKVKPDEIDVSFDADEHAPRMNLQFLLIDAG